MVYADTCMIFVQVFIDLAAQINLPIFYLINQVFPLNRR